MASALHERTVFQEIKSISIDKHVFENQNNINFTSSVEIPSVMNNVTQNSVLIPFNDILITKMLDKFLFPHPQLLISLVSTKSMIDDFDFYYLLKLHFLRDIGVNKKSILECLAQSNALTTEEIMFIYSTNYSQEDSMNEWNNSFSSILTDFSRIFNREWVLNSVDDLFSLHSLCVSLDCKLYLTKFLESYNEDDGRFLYSLSIGKQDSNQSIILYCHSPSEYSLLGPVNREKKIKDFPPKCSILTSIVTPNNQVAFYIDTNSLFDSLGKISMPFNEVKGSVSRDNQKSIGISFNLTGERLNIELEIGSNNIGNEQLQFFMNGFECPSSDISSELEVLKSFGRSQLIFSANNWYLIEQEVKISEITADMFQQMYKEKHFYMLSDLFSQFNFPIVPSNSEISLTKFIRLMSPFSKNSVSPIFGDVDSCVLSAFTESYPLSQASNHPYSQLVCLESLLEAATNSRTISCKYCHCNRRSNDSVNILMVPIRSEKSPFIKWLCMKCFRCQSKQFQAEIMSMFLVFYSSFDIYSNIITEEKCIILLSQTLRRIHLSIMSLRSQPIGSLRSIIPRIDAAYNELLSILKLYRQRILSIKSVSINDLITIRNSSEYKARIGPGQRIVPLPEPDYEVVDYKLFSQYLSGVYETGIGNTSYMLTLPEKEISNSLITKAHENLINAEGPVSQSIRTISIGMKDVKSSTLLINAKLSMDSKEIIGNLTQNVYQISKVFCNGINSVPISKIRTSHVLKSLFLMDNSLRFVLHDQKQGRIFISESKFGQINDNSMKIICEVDDVFDCSISICRNGSIAVLSIDDNISSLIIISFENGDVIQKKIGEYNGQLVEWDANGTYVCIANSDCYTYEFFDGNENEYVDFESDEIGQIIKLIYINNTFHAFFDSGDVIDLSENQNQYSFESEIKDAYFITRNSVTTLVSINIDDSSSFIELDSADVDIETPVSSLPPVFSPGILIDLKSFDKTLTLSKLGLSIIESFPSMISYFYGKSMVIIRKDMSSYKPNNSNNILVSSIVSSYTKYKSYICLHSSEGLLNSLSIPVLILGFLSFDHTNTCKQIDILFGTKLQFVQKEGIWITTKVTNSRIYLILVINLSKEQNYERIIHSLIASGINLILSSSNNADVSLFAQSLYSSQIHPSHCSLLTIIRSVSQSVNTGLITTLLKESLIKESIVNHLKLSKDELSSWMSKINSLPTTNSSSAISTIKDALALTATSLDYPQKSIRQISSLLRP